MGGTAIHELFVHDLPLTVARFVQNNGFMSEFKSRLSARSDKEWASLLGCTERAVASWRYGTRRPSVRMAVAIEAAGIPRHVSRPDVWHQPSQPVDSGTEDLPSAP